MSAAPAVEHRGFLLHPRKDGTVDCVERSTGRWFNRPNMRSAKWWCSVYAKVAQELTK